MNNLIENLPEERKAKIKQLLKARQNFVNPKDRAKLAKALNAEVRDLNLRYCSYNGNSVTHRSILDTTTAPDGRVRF